MALGHPDRWLAAFLEGELPPRRQRRIARHLRGCPRCTRRLALVRAGLAATRELRPETPPPELDRRLREILATPTAGAALHPAKRPSGVALLARFALPTAAAVALLVWGGSRRGAEVEVAVTPPGAFERLAVASHRGLGDGGLTGAGRRSSVAGESPAAVRAWLAERGLSAALAEHRPAPDAASFVLVGATDVSRPGLRAAAVRYRIDGAALTLLVARQEEVTDAPRWGPFGKRIRFREEDGTHLLTWTNSGKAYALASASDGGGAVQRGCLLCHAEGRRAEQARRLALPARTRG
jgi:anti-sigma factor RsiW